MTKHISAQPHWFNRDGSKAMKARQSLTAGERYECGGSSVDHVKPKGSQVNGGIRESSYHMAIGFACG